MPTLLRRSPTRLMVPLDRTWLGPDLGRIRPFYASWEDAVKWPYPFITSTRTRTFSTQAQLDTIVGSLVDGDYIVYNGSGKLAITNASSNGYVFSGINTGSLGVVFNFGCPFSTDYVEFSSTASANFSAAWVRNCTNVGFIGGALTTTNNAGNGILWHGNTTNCFWYDFYAHDCAANGAFIAPVSSTTITGCRWRGIITNCGQNDITGDQTRDPHNQKGCGLHGIQFDDANSGTVTNCVLAVYVHDQPTGAAVQCGDSGGVALTNNTFFLKAKNLTKVATNSPQSDIAGNVFQLWGSVTETGNVAELLQGESCQGRVVDVNGLTNSSAGYVIKHARAKSCCLNSTWLAVTEAGVSSTEPFDNRASNVTYQDKRGL